MCVVCVGVGVLGFGLGCLGLVCEWCVDVGWDVWECCAGWLFVMVSWVVCDCVVGWLFGVLLEV